MGGGLTGLNKIWLTLAVISMAGPVLAETQANTRYLATIWVDPDGCQHWVMDTGAEGFMSARLDRQGKPVCNQAIPDLFTLRAQAARETGQ
jgi:hypothetical protein